MTPDDSMELVEMVARASFKNWRDNATAKGLHMDLGMTFEDMSESEREFADRHAAAILTAIEASGRRIVPVAYTVEMFQAGDAAFKADGGPSEIWEAMLSASPKVTT